MARANRSPANQGHLRCYPHPQPQHCVAQEHEEGDAGAVLGGVPHMIRGQLGGFQQSALTGRAFSQCTACSPTVVEAWLTRGWPFVAESLQVRMSQPDRV